MRATTHTLKNTNQHHRLSILFSFGFLLPAVCPAQSINRAGYATAGDTLAGVTEGNSTSTNVAGAGSLSIAATANRSSASARSSVVADSFALRFSARATAHGAPPLTAGSLHGSSGGASMGASYSDAIIIASPSLPPGSHPATARVRLLISSQRLVTGNTNWASGSVSLGFSLATGSSTWETNSVNGFPNAEVLKDVPVGVEGPSLAYSPQYFALSAVANASATSYEEGHFTAATTSITVTWGGIISLKLNDGTVISDFTATGATGAAYRGQRLRTDQMASVSKPSASAIALQWAGTSNIFYQVESAASLAAGSWSPMSGAIEGNGANAVMEGIVGSGNRFYRVVDAPLP
jgi:hypothetical protein